MVATKTRHTSRQELMRAERGHHHEFERVCADWTIHHSSPLPFSGQAMVRNPRGAGDSEQLHVPYHEAARVRVPMTDARAAPV